jgi:16S rRNA (cytidine1402-2'-O)-methyltransferase
MTGTLYLVGTPIGNLQDITLRAIATLQTVQLIAAEDTRHTGKLLQHFQITTPQISYHQHNRQQRISELIPQLQQGKNIALVSDAGMPAIADPGLELVKACIQAQIPVVPIPGVSACLTALIASGIDTSQFVFMGFWRAEYGETIATETRTIVLYEAPHRLHTTLSELAQWIEPTRSLMIGRELTKLHEELWRGDLATALKYFTIHPPKGEFTIVIAGKTATPLQWTEASLRQELKELIEGGMTKSNASKHLADLTQLSRRYLYQLSLSLDQMEHSSSKNDIGAKELD